MDTPATAPALPTDLCPCGSSRQKGSCCLQFIGGQQQPQTAEALMRARYSAYALGHVAYIAQTTAPAYRKTVDLKAIRQWSEFSTWRGLKILSTTAGQAADTQGSVEFVASYEQQGTVHEHHELSHFQKHHGQWYFTYGTPGPVDESAKSVPVRHATPPVGRNHLCPCGSQQKYKKCCGK